MLSSARLGGSICVTGAALWRWLANFVTGAVFSACVCVAGAASGSCLKGLDVFERAARGLNLRDRRSTDFVAGAAFSASGCVCVCLRGRGSTW